MQKESGGLRGRSNKSNGEEEKSGADKNEALVSTVNKSSSISNPQSFTRNNGTSSPNVVALEE